MAKQTLPSPCKSHKSLIPSTYYTLLISLIEDNATPNYLTEQRYRCSSFWMLVKDNVKIAGCASPMNHPSTRMSNIVPTNSSTCLPKPGLQQSNTIQKSSSCTVGSSDINLHRTQIYSSEHKVPEFKNLKRRENGTGKHKISAPTQQLRKRSNVSTYQQMFHFQRSSSSKKIHNRRGSCPTR